MVSVFDPPPGTIGPIVTAALAEDLTPLGDISAAVLDPGTWADGVFFNREPGVLAGTACATETFRQVDPELGVDWHASDGEWLPANTTIGTVEGALAGILTAERTALNFLGHLSGIATHTRRFVEAAAPLRVWDTRKTLPGLRSLQKAAVRAGGARNHRGNLSDWVMFKDNHLTVIGIDEAVRRARDQWPGRTVHVECDRPDQLREALDAGADAALLDNMSPAEIRECVRIADDHAARTGTRRALLEISGGITLDTVGGYTDTGADVVSSGSLTNSAPVLDIGLDIEVA